MEQMIDVTKISDPGDEGRQRAVMQFLDDTNHEPISRISASTRELKRIVSLFESVIEKMYSAMFGAGALSHSFLERGGRASPRILSPFFRK